MLTGNEGVALESLESATPLPRPTSTADANESLNVQVPANHVDASVTPTWQQRIYSVEWLRQTVASLCWIASVFVYGISSTGDWLQLGAATAWLIANLASLANS